MSYSLENRVPSLKANTSEMVDFMEFQCLISPDKSYSISSIRSTMGIADDELLRDEDIDEEQENYRYLLEEIDERNMRCRDKYPFFSNQYSIRLKDDISLYYSNLYTYLLVATRENMRNRKMREGIDGTVLFERLCACLLDAYLGCNSESIVFGTGAVEAQTFSEKMKTLLDRLNEGFSYRVPDGDQGKNKDANLDVVAWIPFSDSRKGQLIILGQCKTGTSWREKVNELSVDGFFGSFSYPMPCVKPIKMFLVTESFVESWEQTIRYSESIFFDRSRVMDHLPENLDEPLLNDIMKWTDAVIGAYRNG